MRNNAALTASGIVKRYGKRLVLDGLQAETTTAPADIRTSTVEITSTSRADPAGPRRRLPPVPAARRLRCARRIVLRLGSDCGGGSNAPSSGTDQEGGRRGARRDALRSVTP